MKTLQGRFTPTKPDKYIGDVISIYYRSSWELRFMKWLDRTDSIIKWASEEHIVPYISPIDNKRHRYFLDFYMKVKNVNCVEEDYLVEIKPKKQTKQPITPKKPTKTFLNEIVTWEINSAKWKAAHEHCEKSKMKFIILTEDDLF